VNIINYSWIYIYKKIFKFSKPSILEDRIWDTDISSSTSMDITFNTLNTMCFTLKIIVSWSFGNKIVIFMDDRSKSSNKSCDKFCIFASCSPPPWEEAQWHMLIKLWVAFVAIHLCPCALSLLFFLSLVNLLSSFLCAEKPLQAQLRSAQFLCKKRNRWLPPAEYCCFPHHHLSIFCSIMGNATVFQNNWFRYLEEDSL
jgi:hypothetical protein